MYFIGVATWVFFFLSCTDSDRHISAESQKEPELSGTMCQTAGILLGVGYGMYASQWSLHCL